MNKPSIIAIQWIGVVFGIVCAVAALWGFFGGWLDIGWVVALAYGEMCALLVAFAAWYCRYYLSDEFVLKTAKYAVEHNIDPDLVEATIETHPRKADIRQEIVRQRGG